MNVEQLILDNLSRVTIIAGIVLRAWGASFSDWDDLISAGNLGLVKAAYRFDARRGYTFSTYASYKIEGAMKDYLRWHSPSFPRKCSVRLRKSDLLRKDSEHANVIDRVTVDKLLSSLNPRDEQIIRLLYLKDKTGIEVAAAVGLSGSRVSALERGAMNQLSQLR